MAVWERGTPGRPARHSLGRTGFILLYMALYIRRLQDFSAFLGLWPHRVIFSGRRWAKRKGLRGSCHNDNAP
ncbi:hypothetical protein VUR80DRAFT_4581 [Thermomyces stellatus]